jgi:hypothetical protein
MKKRCRRSGDAATTCTPPTPALVVAEHSRPPGITACSSSSPVSIVACCAPAATQLAPLSRPSAALARLVVTTCSITEGSSCTLSTKAPVDRLAAGFELITARPRDLYFKGYMNWQPSFGTRLRHFEHHGRRLNHGLRSEHRLVISSLNFAAWSVKLGLGWSRAGRLIHELGVGWATG